MDLLDYSSLIKIYVENWRVFPLIKIKMNKRPICQDVSSLWLKISELLIYKISGKPFALVWATRNKQKREKEMRTQQ